MDDEPAIDDREAALKRLKIRREFRTHVATYVLVNLLLVGIWALSGGGYFWPIWTIGGWGIGLGFHAWATYGERDFTEDEIRSEMRRHSG